MYEVADAFVGFISSQRLPRLGGEFEGKPDAKRSRLDLEMEGYDERYGKRSRVKDCRKVLRKGSRETGLGPDIA